jgi:integrase
MDMLTAKKVEQLKTPGRYRDGSGVKGLLLQIGPNGGKSWLLRYERAGKERWHGIGPWPLVDLKTARERAKAARLLLLDGIDPVDHRKAEKAKLAAAAAKLMTFREAARLYVAQHEGKWKNRKHRQQFVSTLEIYAHAVIGDMSVNDVGTTEVLRVIEPHWLTKCETMSRVRGRVEAVLDWASVRGYRTGENPARWKGHLAEVLPARSEIKATIHHPALPWREVPSFMAELRRREGVAARALEFTILTAARTGEVIGSKWPEIDLPGRTWTVPAARMKGGKEHRVPLSVRAIELLRALPTETNNSHVFIGSRAGSGLSNTTLSQLLKTFRASITTHGFRSTFRDWASETTHFPNQVVEMALAHAIGDKVEAAYRRGDLLLKRRQLAESWARFCYSPPVGKADDKTVVPLRA